jgi:hypothetical protein
MKSLTKNPDLTSHQMMSKIHVAIIAINKKDKLQKKKKILSHA